MRDYIPVKKHWLEMFTKYDKPYWTPVLKFPIEEIKINKSLFSYQNEVLQSDVLYMLMNFDRNVWMPITLNMGLSYIDAVIEDSELLNKKEVDGKRRRYQKIKSA